MRKCLAALILLVAVPTIVRADLLQEPAVFSSRNGLLDVLVIAKAQPVPTIEFYPPSGGGAIHPIGWVYEVCARPDANATDCPAGSGTVADYGGVRLALQPGDTLKVRLVNRLPLLDPAKVTHAADPGMGNLPLNPTNLHTHGLAVAARAPTVSDPTFGDYVFVNIFNPANGMPVPQSGHRHGSVKMDYADYRIDIPADHPTGLFWFHAHIHGLSVNQLAGGLSGIISVGSVQTGVPDAPPVVRNMMLKDMQVLSAGNLVYESGPVTVQDGEVQYQESNDFCEAIFKGPPNGRQGFCDGAPAETVDGNSFVGSRWFFTINGQVFPTVPITSSNGEVWQLTNASPQITYRLNLVDDSTNKAMPVQLIAIDGVSIDVPAGTPPGTIMTAGGNRFTVVDCPGAGASLTMPVCITDLILMPSSRAQIWVTYRDAQGMVVAPPAGATATLTQYTPDLGPVAENWPLVRLAKIEFEQAAVMRPAVHVTGLRSAPAAVHQPGAVHKTAHAAPPPQVSCRPLPAGHRRRIFFGMVDPSDESSPFGLGYEEVDGNGAVVPGTSVPVSAFDPDRTTVCLPLGSGGAAVHEIWEIVNLATEAHNFHIHQTRFSVLAGGGLSPGRVPDNPMVVEDSVPLAPAVANTSSIADNQNGYCTIAQWRNQACTSPATVVDIPFTQYGDFMYHCHIAEHTDLGMMSRISVVSSTRTGSSKDDFDANGLSDIFWGHTSGTLATWLVAGEQVVQAVSFGPVAPGWSPIRIADFDGDGKADLLWRHTGGNLAVWLMDGGTVRQSVTIGLVDPAWTIVGAADLDGDGQADLVWRHNGGQVAASLVDRGTVRQSTDLGVIDQGWSVAGVADVDGDGKADILWRSTSGELSVWLMDGVALRQAVSIGAVPNAWSVVGTGDYDGDGQADILWRHTDGELAVWLMQGGTVRQGMALGLVDTAWSAVGTGDFNGDGTADILWRHSAGELAVWYVRQAAFDHAAGFGTVPMAWQTQTSR